MSRKSYTAEQIEQTEQHIPASVRESIRQNVRDFLVEFTQTSAADADEFSERVLPVVLALIDDGMQTGKYIAEEKFAKMLMEALERGIPATQSPPSFSPSAN